LNGKSTILTALLLSWLCAGTTAAQEFEGIYKDIPERKNAISFTILPLIDRTFSFSYARKLKTGIEVTFNPRVKFASRNVATEPGTDQGSNKVFLFVTPDPQWFYNHFMFRSGLRIPLTENFGYEPQLQLAYGSFFNKVLKTEDAHGDAYDEYVRLDRQYFSAGIINAVSWVRDFDHVRIKWFVGLGVHARRYWETQHAHYLWHRPTDFSGPETHTYYRGRFTVHGGLEIGMTY
jgi:hypothetical protein